MTKFEWMPVNPCVKCKEKIGGLDGCDTTTCGIFSHYYDAKVAQRKLLEYLIAKTTSRMNLRAGETSVAMLESMLKQLEESK